MVTQRDHFQAIPTGLEIAVQLRKQHPNDWDIANLNRLLSNRKVYEAIERGDPVDQIVDSYQVPLREFLVRRSRYLLYD